MRAWPYLATVVVMCWAASPALAASQSVSVEDNQFNQSRVAVKPGETVTWTTSGGGTHNVTFEDGLLTDPLPARPGPWSTLRTFAATGTYRYFCQVHGGQGMTGIVDVNAAGSVPPTARFTATPTSAQPGQTVAFNAAGSLDLDGSITQYEWDLDGDGSYETNTGTTPATSRLYATAGTFVVKLRVTDNLGTTGGAARSLIVNTKPTASFTVSPSSALPGVTVRFDASASVDLDGTIMQHEWDLNGNGLYETSTGATPTTSRSYADPAAVTVNLRVTDNLGGTGQATRALQINRRAPMVAPTPISALPANWSPPQPPSFAGSKRSVRVGQSGGFSYSFRAQEGLSGTAELRSISKVRVGARWRRVRLGKESFTVPDSGIVKLGYKLSRGQLRVLRREARIKFRVLVTVRAGRGRTTDAEAALTLKRPRRLNR